MKFESDGTWIVIYGEDVLTFSRTVHYDEVLDEAQYYANKTKMGATIYETTEQHPKHKNNEDWQPVYSGLPDGEMDQGGWIAITPDTLKGKFTKRFKDSWSLGSKGYHAVECTKCGEMINV